MLLRSILIPYPHLPMVRAHIDTTRILRKVTQQPWKMLQHLPHSLIPRYVITLIEPLLYKCFPKVTS
jgi:hypothetical protein